MSYTYAVADIHGRADLLDLAYDEIMLHDYGGTIIHLGDYVDRGPESRQVIEFLMDESTVPPGFRRIILRGNHEDMMHGVFRGAAELPWWLGNGGNETLASYGWTRGEPVRADIVTAEHLDWIAGLPVTHADAHRIYVHGGLDPTKSFEDQNVELLTWWRYPPGFAEGFGGKHVVHGHTPNRYGPELYSGRTNLDTGAFFTGRLAIGVFDDDKPGGPVDIINVVEGAR